MIDESRRYRIYEPLGQGGFGSVYRAELEGQSGFSKQVALKILNPDMQNNEEVTRRLRDEARILGLLRHRAIVQVDALLLLNGRWTVVMEYVEGCDLSAIIRRGPMPVGPAIEIIEEVASALHTAYSRTKGSDGQPLHLLHRDIKPGNIQVTSAGEVKVLDFGIAKAQFSERESETSTLHYGSVGYMAPERFYFEDTHEGDIWALGAVLYELVSGRPLGKVQALERNYNETIEQMLIAIKERTDDDDLVDLLRKTMAYDHNDRPDAKGLKDLCRETRRKYRQLNLADWAEEHVPQIRGQLQESTNTTDGLTGTILVEGRPTELRTDAPKLPLANDFEPIEPDEANAHTQLRNPADLPTMARSSHFDDADEQTISATVQKVAPSDSTLKMMIGGALLITLLLFGTGALLLSGIFAGTVAANVDPGLVNQPAPKDPEPAPEPAPKDPEPTPDPVEMPEPVVPEPVAPEPVEPEPAKPEPQPVKPVEKPDKPAEPVASKLTAVQNGTAYKVVLQGGGKTYSLPGAVPAGSYKILADFGDGLTNAGAASVGTSTLSIKCNNKFKKCRAK